MVGADASYCARRLRTPSSFCKERFDVIFLGEVDGSLPFAVASGDREVPSPGRGQDKPLADIEVAAHCSEMQQRVPVRIHCTNVKFISAFVVRALHEPFEHFKTAIVCSVVQHVASTK